MLEKERGKEGKKRKEERKKKKRKKREKRGSADVTLKKTIKQERSRESWKELERVFGSDWKPEEGQELIETPAGLNPNMFEGLKVFHFFFSFLFSFLFSFFLDHLIQQKK